MVREDGERRKIKWTEKVETKWIDREGDVDVESRGRGE